MSREPGATIVKDPQSIEPYGFDWTDYLAEIDATETVVTSTWAVTGSDTALTVTTPAIVVGGLKTQGRLNGGTLWETYTVTNSVVTSSGVHDDRSFYVRVENK